MAALAKRRAEVPGEVASFMRLPGLGPKTAARIWRELDVTTLAELKAAAEGERIRALSGMGAATEAKILKALAEGEGRRPSHAEDCSARDFRSCARSSRRSAAHPSAIDVSEAGSTRRRRETFRDLDVIATATDPAALTAYFVSLPWVLEVVAHGDTKATGDRPRQGFRLDLRVVPPESYGDLLQHFTGSKDHNIALREDAAAARALDLRVRRHGRRDGRGARPSATRSRCTRSSATRSSRRSCARTPASSRLREPGSCRTLVELGDLARRDALPLHVVGRRQGDDRGDGARCRRARLRVPLPHGSFALPPRGTNRAAVGARSTRSTRASSRSACSGASRRTSTRRVSSTSRTTCSPQLDWVVASLHTSFDRSPTERVLAAIENPHVDCIGHLTGRRISRRHGAELDIERDHRPSGGDRHRARDQRPTGPARHARRARAARRARRGSRSRSTTDAHSPASLAYAELGIGQARRAWLTKEQVLNTRPWAEIEAAKR